MIISPFIFELRIICPRPYCDQRIEDAKVKTAMMYVSAARLKTNKDIPADRKKRLPSRRYTRQDCAVPAAQSKNNKTAAQSGM
jgi:hypothetical protein